MMSICPHSLVTVLFSLSLGRVTFILNSFDLTIGITTFFLFALSRNQVRKVKHERYENTDEVNAILK